MKKILSVIADILFLVFVVYLGLFVWNKLQDSVKDFLQQRKKQTQQQSVKHPPQHRHRTAR